MQERRLAGWWCLGFWAFYLAAVAPFTFFRHDDWWILGNSVVSMPLDWGLLWRPTLLHNGEEIVWFFRPGFKLGTYLFFHLFGFHYVAWIAALSALGSAALFLGSEIARRLFNARAGLWFVLIAGASLPLHFGSFAWVGEGMMNIPQLFFLFASTLMLLYAVDRAVWIWPSVLAFVLALSFKESSLFHLAFLGAVFFFEPGMQRVALRRRAGLLAPFAVLGLFYLTVRLGWMPVNPGYIPRYDWHRVLYTVAMGVAPVALPLMVWGAFLRWGHERLPGALWITRLAYLPFWIVSLGIYVGHGFFSPGWYLVMGWTVLLAFAALVPAAIPRRQLLCAAAVVLVLALGPMLLRLDRLGWWKWKAAQVEFFELARENGDLEKITVRNCTQAPYTDIYFDRVVANEEGVRQIWRLLHGRSIHVQIGLCNLPATPGPHHRVLDWSLR